MKAVLGGIADWLEHRTGMISNVHHFLYEDIPGSCGWRHVFGSVALFLFMLQVFSGILLTLNYAPAPEASYYSLQYILTEVTGGSVIRGLHHWGASILIIVVGLHLLQTAVYGAYKKPREATWVVGVALLLLIIAFGLTGHLLPWTNRAYWSTVVTTEIAGLVPLMGAQIRELMGSEGGAIGVKTYARFYSMHVNILPIVTMMLIFFHVYLVRKHGVTPAPDDRGPKIKFYPVQVYRDTVAIFFAFAVLFLMAAFVQVPLEKIADPTDKSFVPRPEWYFMALFQTLKLFEGQWEMVGAIVLPGIAVLLLILVPFLDREELKALRNRTVAVGVISFAMIGWTSLTVAGIMSSPEDSVTAAAESGVTDMHWAELSPKALTGLAYFRDHQCSKCHNLFSGEPKAGPTLATLTNKASSNVEVHLKQLAVERGLPEFHLEPEAGAALVAFVGSLTPENAMNLDTVPQSIINGARVYEKNQCSMCHQINGEGMTVGPPFNGLGAHRTADWVKAKIQDPKATAPETLMPPFRLPQDELDALAAYLTALP